MVRIIEIPTVITQEEEIKEKVVQIRRVVKVVKGGKKLHFRALVVVGDIKGHVGVGVAKAAEVSAAIRKAVETAKKQQIAVPLVGRTIPHEAVGIFGASKVLIKPAPIGRGVIAGGSVRPVLELAGIKDVVAKRFGGSSAINVARATLEAILELKTREEIETMLGKVTAEAGQNGG